MKFSLDNLICLFFKPISELSDNVEISSNFIYEKNSTVLYIMIPPRIVNFDYCKLIKYRLKKKRYSFLEYKIDSTFFADDSDRTLDIFNKIKVKVLEDINNYKNKYNFSEINIIGISIGCVETMMIANSTDLINKIILVVSGNDLALSMWTGIRTRDIKNLYKKII